MINSIIEFFNPTYLITAVGLFGVIGIVFAESGLFFGFFLPGDSLLFTAGFLASLGHFNVAWLWLGCMLAAIAGDSVGYAFGKKVGPKIFTREDSLFFHKKHVERTAQFYARYGKKTIVLARFVPIVRTFAPILAGVGQMPYRVFVSYNVVGGVLWTTLLVFLGFFLGMVIPSPDQYLMPIIAGIVLISFLPLLREWWKNRRSGNAILKK